MRLAAVATAACEPFRIVLADQHCPERIVPQRVVIQQVFVAQAECEDPLLEQVHQRMFDQLGIAVVGETPRELLDEPEAVLDLFQQQSTAVRCDPAAIQPGRHRAPADLWKQQPAPATLCFPETASVLVRK